MPPSPQIATPLTPAQAKRYLRVGMVVAWNFGVGWSIETIEDKSDLNRYIKIVSVRSDRVIILEE